MRKAKNILIYAIVLVLAVSLLGIGSFANETSSNPDIQLDIMEEVSGNDELIEEDGANIENTQDELEGKGITSIKAYPDYKSVTLKWDAVEGVENYAIYKAKNKEGKFKLLEKVTNTSFRDKKNSKDKTYYYKVFILSDSVSTGEDAKIVSAARVRTAYYTIKFKTKTVLYSHDKSHKRVVFKKNQKVRAEGFGIGAYKFYYRVGGKNRLFNAKRIRIRGASGNIKANSYTQKTAELFVNHSKKKSKTKYFIWANLYSQRIFVLKKVDGKWDCIKDYPCGSGKAISPSPTGWSKEIHNKQVYRKGHGKKYWCSYSSWNSFHNGLPSSCKKKDKGRLVSSGCIRLSGGDAVKFYNMIPLHTAAIVF